ncbi:hypothetical protein A9C11_18180 [Pseudomonas citronellolis]|uniref:Nudix hydrolase domain-containing protein n=1 Tax=Pseudomonas citronellolis TaxID=53408 RepID=A0A1A9KFA1_9PSED|nr:NUDIX pyrophosphatase [Pseudomonas citronellolis]ANI15780.1 hypothetical protein A9C11_18180 [Pseudomonas citronellolis]
MREPFQILAIPFRKKNLEEYEFAALKRADLNVWQGVAGGGEQGEIPIEAAKREAKEELGIDDIYLIKLSTISSIPRSCFSQCEYWPEDIFVVPEYSFGVDCTGLKVTISSEHSEIIWGGMNEISSLYQWDSNKTALWELDKRLKLGITV